MNPMEVRTQIQVWIAVVVCFPCALSFAQGKCVFLCLSQLSLSRLNSTHVTETGPKPLKSSSCPGQWIYWTRISRSSDCHSRSTTKRIPRQSNLGNWNMVQNLPQMQNSGLTAWYETRAHSISMTLKTSHARAPVMWDSQTPVKMGTDPPERKGASRMLCEQTIAMETRGQGENTNREHNIKRPLYLCFGKRKLRLYRVRQSRNFEDSDQTMWLQFDSFDSFSPFPCGKIVTTGNRTSYQKKPKIDHNARTVVVLEGVNRVSSEWESVLPKTNISCQALTVIYNRINLYLEVALSG